MFLLFVCVFMYSFPRVESYAYQLLLPGQDPGLPNSDGCLDAINPSNGICGAAFEPISSDYFIKVARSANQILNNGSTFQLGETLAVSFVSTSGSSPSEYIIESHGANFSSAYCANTRVGVSQRRYYGISSMSSTATLTMPLTAKVVSLVGIWGLGFANIKITKKFLLFPSSSNVASKFPSSVFTAKPTTVPSTHLPTKRTTSVPSTTPHSSSPSSFKPTRSPSSLPTKTQTKGPSKSPSKSPTTHKPTTKPSSAAEIKSTVMNSRNPTVSTTTYKPK
mmetsp:Transcript_33874/g.46434  ORF Transcript_33874/g.46434 Transcript_33874/m.46434 type:complete len:278 (+) Transcript_33874:50-883(+)